MNDHVSKNYNTDGGNRTVIGGVLEFEDGAEVRNMPALTGTAAEDAGKKVLLFGDFQYYWVADRTNRTFRRLNELYAVNDQVGFIGTQRVDGKLILPEAMKVLGMGAKT